ncbi:hypothetical protein E2I00_005263, partial [Balaenoptera physalus]
PGGLALGKEGWFPRIGCTGYLSLILAPLGAPESLGHPQHGEGILASRSSMRYRDIVEYESKKAAVSGFIGKIGHMAQRRDDILPRARKEGRGRDFRLEPPGTDKALVGLPGPDMFCLFHGKRYSPGESWHPYLEPQGLMYCLRCTCSESAHVSCYRLHCPPVHCPQPVTEPQQCCPRCVEPHTPSGLRAPPRSCQHNGTTYQHGEIFSAHELLPSRLPNQYGSSEKSAEEDATQSPRGVSLCPVFPGPSGSVTRAILRPLTAASVWLLLRWQWPVGELHPSCPLQRHSQDPCSGDGGRKRDPSTPSPTGPSAPLGFLPRHFRPKEAGSTTVKIVLKEKHKKEDKADPDHSEISATKCPKAPGRVLVHTSVSPSPDNLRRFALEREASDQVEIYLWKLVKGIFHLTQIKKVRKQDFQKEAQNFRLLTGTHKGHWNVFLAQTPELKVTASPDKVTKTL